MRFSGLLLIASCILTSCVSTQSTLKNVDNSAIKPHVNNNRYEINEYASDTKYGFDEDYPINIGLLIATQEEKHVSYFFNALEGENGETISYQKTGTCCPFPTTNNAMGAGTISIYEVTFEKSNKKKIIYFNIHEKGKMLCPKGFSIKPKNN